MGSLKTLIIDDLPERFSLALHDLVDDSGDKLVELPDAFMARMGWEIGDALEGSVSLGTIKLVKHMPSDS